MQHEVKASVVLLFFFFPPCLSHSGPGSAGIISQTASLTISFSCELKFKALFGEGKAVNTMACEW